MDGATRPQFETGERPKPDVATCSIRTVDYVVSKRVHEENDTVKGSKKTVTQYKIRIHGGDFMPQAVWDIYVRYNAL